MIRLFILRFWPVLLMLLCAYLWRMWIKRPTRDGIVPTEEMLARSFKRWMIAVFITLLLCFVWLIMETVTKTGDFYTPSQYSDGQITRHAIR